MAKRWEEKEEKEEEEKVVGRNMDLFPLLSLLHAPVVRRSGGIDIFAPRHRFDKKLAQGLTNQQKVSENMFFCLWQIFALPLLNPFRRRGKKKMPLLSSFSSSHLRWWRRRRRKGERKSAKAMSSEAHYSFTKGMSLLLYGFPPQEKNRVKQGKRT